MSNLDFLLSRVSCSALCHPAPDQDQLHQILSAAMCAPDHGKLRPWRFIVITDDYRQQWLDNVKAIMAKPEYGYPDGYMEKVLKKFSNAPLILALGMRKMTRKTSVTIDEQLMAASAAVMNVLNAIHALNFGAIWVTGPIANPEIVSSLGFQEPYRMMGFMFIGTPAEHKKIRSRPDVNDYVAVWKGKPVSFKVDSDS